MIRHGARAQSPPLDIMCLPAARTRTHHLPRVCVRARALLCRPPKCIRSIIEFSLSYDARVPIYRAADGIGTSIEICGGSRSAHARRGSGEPSGPPFARNADQEKIDGRHGTRVVRQFRSFRPRGPRHEERESARGDTARCSPFPATAEATHVARRSFVIRQIAFLPRARGAKCVCDARTRSHARLLHLP